MFSYASWRTWHKWAGLILLPPVSVIAATGFLWNHEKSLGLKPVTEKEARGDSLPTASVNGPDFGAAAGTWRPHAVDIDKALSAAALEWGENAPLERIELRNEPGYGMIVKVKVAHDMEIRADKPDEIFWSVSEQNVVARKGIAEERSWAETIHDLHTGKFFGKQYGFFWADAGSMAILFLGSSGLVLFVVPLWKKRNNRKRRHLASPSIPASEPLKNRREKKRDEEPIPVGVP